MFRTTICRVLCVDQTELLGAEEDFMWCSGGGYDAGLVQHGCSIWALALIALRPLVDHPRHGVPAATPPHATTITSRPLMRSGWAPTMFGQGLREQPSKYLPVPGANFAMMRSTVCKGRILTKIAAVFQSALPRQDQRHTRPLRKLDDWTAVSSLRCWTPCSLLGPSL